ncbi:Replication factor A protein 2 [Conglomerata obtusa]
MSDIHEAGFIPSSPRRENTGTRTLRNFTIKQIKSIDIDNTPYKKDNAEISNITLAGWVRTTKKLSNGIAFTIDDHTSQIDCTFFSSGTYDEEMCSLVEENNLLRISGNIRVFNGKVNVGVSHIKKTNLEYFIYHNISCVYQHLYYNNKLKRDVKEKKEQGFEEIQNDILDVYRQNQSESGLHLDVVIRMLSGKHRENLVRDNVEIMLESGILYCVDGLEYKTTVS